MKRSTVVIFVIVTLSILDEFVTCVAKRRWCTDGKFMQGLQNMTQYNDKEKVCIKCQSEEKLIALSELNRYECCAGEVTPIGVCPPDSVLYSCSAAPKCDNKRQCREGWDEVGCFGCGNESFSCSSDSEDNQCISMDKVCDSKKHCADGKDETLCSYFGGWCDGFLCGGQHKACIGYNQICDGRKDCVDGSDESNCQYCPNQFRCRTYFREDNKTTSAECVGMFRVCDGERSCIDGSDESGCYVWQEWSTWSECGAETESCTRIRRRSCMDSKGVIVSSKYCTKNESDVNENDIDICPECWNVGELNSLTSTVPEEEQTTQQNVSQGQSNRLPFSIGALAGIVVAGSLLFVGIIVAIAMAVLGSMGRTGFWRPTTKLPRPESSTLPGVGNSSANKVKPTPEGIPNPYADDGETGRVNGIVSSRNTTVATTTFMRSIN